LFKCDSATRAFYGLKPARSLVQFLAAGGGQTFLMPDNNSSVDMRYFLSQRMLERAEIGNSCVYHHRLSGGMSEEWVARRREGRRIQ